MNISSVNQHRIAMIQYSNPSSLADTNHGQQSGELILEGRRTSSERSILNLLLHVIIYTRRESIVVSLHVLQPPQQLTYMYSEYRSTGSKYTYNMENELI